MKGDAKPLVHFLGKNDRFEIPIYQRSYSWRKEQCAQLFSDLEMTIKNNKPSHFFGSLVSVAEKDNLLIIDGQQRITTVSLLILALKNAIESGVKVIEDPQKEAAKLYKKYLVDEYSNDSCKLKLRHIPGDAEAFEALFEKDFSNQQSKLVKNYLFFQELITTSGLSASEIIEAISRLLIIDISIEKEDNPQLIFESINSTGVDLNEGDKIRNYVLMDLEIAPQTRFYTKYWKEIELLTARNGEQDGVGLFIRDFLTAKTSEIPNLASIYSDFKKYCSNNETLIGNREKLFNLLLAYAKVYHYLLCPEDMPIPGIARGISYLNKQEVTPSYPFLVEVLLAWNDKKLSDEQSVTVLDILDSYVFRRQMCDLPTNSLNKVFADLHRTIMRFDGCIPYDERLKRVLLDKSGRARFPRDGEFKQAIIEKNVYDMRSKNRKYIFARMENGLTLDAKVFGCKDVVYDKIECGDYSIEHIMPQTLNSVWKHDLGEDYESIHDVWLHRLANLTLTAYNSKLGNKSFSSKVAKNTFSDLVDTCFGFDESAKHLWLNEFPAQQSKWTTEEMEKRAELLANRALQIWKPISVSNSYDLNLNFGQDLEKNLHHAETGESWLIPANGSLYDHEGAFNKFGYIDWKQGKFHFQVGDIVYIYCTYPIGRVRHMTIVDRVNMNFDEITDDREFWSDSTKYESAKGGSYVRLRLLTTKDNENLDLSVLCAHGLIKAPQTPMKVKDDLLYYLKGHFSD